MMLLTVTTSTAVVSAKTTKKSKIDFNSLATGECFVGFTTMTFITVEPFYELDIVFAGLGSGSAESNGDITAVSVPTTNPPPPGELSLYLLGENVYVAKQVKASISAEVSWIDDGITHSLSASIYATKPYPCIFSPETDYFWMPMPGPDPSAMQLLRFDATHVSGSDSEVISGNALFAVMAFPFTPGVTELYAPAVVLFLAWMDEEVGIQYQYSLFWSSETREITELMPFVPFDILAADVFNSNVEVTKAH